MHPSRPPRGARSHPPLRRAQFLVGRGKRELWTRSCSTSPLLHRHALSTAPVLASVRACLRALRACVRADGQCDAHAAGEQDLPKDDPFKPGSTRPQIDPIRKGTKPKPYAEVIIGKRGIGQKRVACLETLCPQCRVPAQRRFSCSHYAAPMCEASCRQTCASLKTCPFSKAFSPLRARSLPVRAPRLCRRWCAPARPWPSAAGETQSQRRKCGYGWRWEFVAWVFPARR
jgi:hypothetical protein